MITNKQDNRNRNWRVDSFITNSGLVDSNGVLIEYRLDNITVSGTENAYYKDSATQEAFVNGSAANITLGNLNTLNSNTRPFNGFGSTVIDVDGNLAASTVPNDALFMSKWGYNAYPRRYSVPGIKTLIGTYTLQASGLICDYVWYVGPSNTIYFQENNSLEAHYPVYVKNNHRYWIFTALVRGQDDGIDVNIYNQDDDLIATENFLFNANEWTQITFSFDINPTGARKLVASITPFSAVQIAAIAMYPTDSLTLSQETPPFAPSIDLYDSIGTNDIIDESIITGKIADDAVGANQIQADTITTYHLASSVEDRIFTASGFRNTVEQVIPNDPTTPRVNTNMVYEASIRDGVVSRAKLQHVDGSVLGNLLAERWSWRHENPCVVNISGGASNWLTLASPSYSGVFNKQAYQVSINTTPTASGETRIYFGSSPTDYNIPIYPKSAFNTSAFPDEEIENFNITYSVKSSAAVATAKPRWGIRLASGADVTMSGYTQTYASTWTQNGDYFNINQISSPTSGILYLETNGKPSLARTLSILDIQLFYSSKSPSSYFQGGNNVYTPNQKQSIDASYIHPTFSLVPIGTMLPFAGASAPTGWLICSGQSLAVASYSGLYNVLGYSWGGSGANFSLPDMRNTVPAGASSTHAFATASGVENVTLTENEMPSHKHQILAPTASVTVQTGIGASASNPAVTSDTTNVGGGAAHTNMQPTKFVYYIIFAGN